MATRYLALIGPVPDALRQAVAHTPSLAGMAAVLTQPTCLLFCNSVGETLILPNHMGAVVGRLFERAGGARVLPATPPPAVLNAGPSGQGRLLENYWGGYVAIQSSADTTNWTFLRDPSGAMPCYYVQTDWGWAIASDIDVLIDMHLIVPSVDWDAMARHLGAFDFRTERTVLSGVSELLAGCRLILEGKHRTINCLWTPWAFVQPGVAADETSRLRHTVEDCVRAWACGFNRILLGVSGGLDSSVVATCLAGHTDVLALTMATQEGEGDERHYARAITHALNLELLEEFHSLQDIDLRRSTSIHLPRPLSGAFGQSENRLKFQLAKDRGIDAFFSGIGGDNVFCYLRSVSPLVDRLKVQGLGTGVFKTLDDICELTGCSVKEALQAAWSQFRSPITRYRWSATTDFIAPDTQAVPPCFDHPWLDAPPGALPGKIAHAAMLLRIQGTIDGFPRTQPAQINPLLSQPIMEACLSIPSWHWCRDGRNRAVTRDAFLAELPAEILTRQSKGGPTSFAYEVIDRNQGTLRDLLIDGELDRAGLLDMSKISEALPVTRPVRAVDYMRLSVLAEAETWARHWRQYTPRALALR